jgi:hypothetical protein
METIQLLQEPYRQPRIPGWTDFGWRSALSAAIKLFFSLWAYNLGETRISE